MHGGTPSLGIRTWMSESTSPVARTWSYETARYLRSAIGICTNESSFRDPLAARGVPHAERARRAGPCGFTALADDAADAQRRDEHSRAVLLEEATAMAQVGNVAGAR